MRRVAIAACLLALGAGLDTAATAQTPARPVTLIVPIAPGGGVDTVARIMAEKLQDKLKQTVMVENRTGAGGVVGTDYVAKAPADGQTLLLIESSAVLQKWLHKSVPFDVTTDFAPIALIATAPMVLFAHPSLPVADPKGLIAYAKTNPGRLSVGTPGIGSPHHLAAAMFNSAAGIDITHIPYRGTAPALTDLVAGNIPLIWATTVAVMPFVQSGKVKPLGASSTYRVPILPDVATVAENALPGFDVDLWFGLAAPAGTPRESLERISATVREIVGMPDVIRRMSDLGYVRNYVGPDQFRQIIVSDHARYGRIIREAGIQPN